MGKEEFSLLSETHEAIESVGFSGAIVAETCGRQFLPLAGGGADPLISVECLADDVAIFAVKVFREGVEAAESFSFLGSLPAGDEHPLFIFGVKVVSGEDGVGGIDRFGGHEEALFLAGFPKIFEVAVSPGAFIAKASAVHAFPLADEGDPVFLAHFVAVNGFATTIPDTEDDAALGGAVDLHPKVSPMPAAGHVVGPKWFFDAGHFTVEGGHFLIALDGIGKMNRGGVAPGLEIKVSVRERRAVEDQGFDLSGGIRRGELEGMVSGFLDFELTKVGHYDGVILAGDVDGSFLAFNLKSERDCLFLFEAELDLGGEVSGGFELAEPLDLDLGIFPAGDAIFFPDPGAVWIGVEVGGVRGDFGRGGERNLQEKWDENKRLHINFKNGRSV